LGVGHQVLHPIRDDRFGGAVAGPAVIANEALHGDASVPRLFRVAADDIPAPEIVLPQVEIDGWVVRDVRALVLDLPERPGWGLLGLNYLQGFNAELQSEKGLLLLAPR
jgi:hypothetical protein